MHRDHKQTDVDLELVEEMASEGAIDLIIKHSNKPLLTHLNADTSWLLSFPCSNHNKQPVPETESNRSYFHLLIDPWLAGEIVVKYRWIMVLKHQVTSAYQSLADVRQLILDLERTVGTKFDSKDDGEPDLVLVSWRIEDHCNEGTLKQLHLSTPIVTVELAANMIRAMKHYTKETLIHLMPDLDIDSVQDLWRASDLKIPSILPSWLRVGRIPSSTGFPYLHWATIIAFEPTYQPIENSSSVQTMLYTPHGIQADRFTNVNLVWTSEHSTFLALLHGLDPAYSPMQANLGIENGVELARKMKPKYWIATHDEHLGYEGVIGWMQSKYKRAFSELGLVPDGQSQEEKEKIEKIKKDVIMKELWNGESFILE